MNRIVLAVLATLLVLPAAAAQTRENRPVSGFHALSVAAVLDVDVVQDGTESLTLEGDADVLSRIESVVQEGRLQLRYRPGTRLRDHARAHAVVHARTLDAVSLAGAGKVRADSLKSDALALSISGSGDMDIGRIAAQRASLAISGSGDMRLAGNAGELKVRISGSGSVDAAKLEARRGDVKIAGAGDATVWVREQLATSISGVGDVRYYGDPSVAKSIRGVGHVTRIASNP
jgi:hypothetical protein